MGSTSVCSKTSLGNLALECKEKTCDNDNCSDCQALETWWNRFRATVDDLIFKSNVHTCRGQKSDEKAVKKDKPGCINKHGNCKARFPREVFEQTEVDPKTGALNVKKGEAWINTLTPLVTYILRCNSDITSLLSGTAIKAIVAYISDYITKPGLKTYSIFEAIKGVFTKNSEMLGGNLERKEKARKLVIQMVNSLTSKMEIGGPMACLYLLGNPDHYTSHKFTVVYWKNYVGEVLSSWRSENDMQDIAPEKLVLQKSNGKYVGFTAVHDYIYRPQVFENKSLYEWVQMSVKCKAPSKKHDPVDSDDELDIIGQTLKDAVSLSSPSKYKATVENADDDDDDELNIHTDDENYLEERPEIELDQTLDSEEILYTVMLLLHPRSLKDNQQPLLNQRVR